MNSRIRWPAGDSENSRTGLATAREVVKNSGSRVAQKRVEHADVDPPPFLFFFVVLVTAFFFFFFTFFWYFFLFLFFLFLFLLLGSDAERGSRIEGAGRAHEPSTRRFGMKPRSVHTRRCAPPEFKQATPDRSGSRGARWLCTLSGNDDAHIDAAGARRA